MTSVLRRVPFVCAAVALVLLSDVASGQVGAVAQRALPLQPVGVDAATGLPALRTDLAALPGLAALGRVRLTGLALPNGATVDLDLQQLDLARLGFGFQVNGIPAPGLLDDLALSVWRGTVVNDPASEVVISFSRKGSSGWVRTGGELVHFMPQPGPGGDWLDHRVLVARESDVTARGMSLGPFCGVAPPNQPVTAPVTAPPAGPPGSVAGAAGDCAMWTCPIAVETDFQLFQLFGDLGAETAYVTTLLAAISDVYEQDVDTVLTFPYLQFYTTAADPWVTPDVFGDTWAMLDEFQAAWEGDGMPAGATLGHYISGGELGGGLAYLGVLNDLSRSYTFGVSADLHGMTPFPIAVDPLNWDFFVVAHELGHNFGAPHTHEMTPPVDECGSFVRCVQGTIMSYCHLCGGLDWITPTFAPQSVALMVAQAGAALTQVGPIEIDPGTVPAYVSEELGTLLTVDIGGPFVGTPLLNYHFAVNAPYQTAELTFFGGTLWGAVLAPPLCNQLPEWYFSMVDPACGAYETPKFKAKVGQKEVVVHDGFEAPSAWTSGLAGDTATAGFWTLGDPVGTYYQPYAEMTVGGNSCWYTGQDVIPGGTPDPVDVDGGKTTLVSPIFDLSAGDARIGFWTWFASDAEVDDSLLVQVSNTLTAPWVTAVTIGPDQEEPFDYWTYHEFLLSNFASPTSQVRVRFVATDGGSASTVEAAIDEFEIHRVACVTTCQENLGFEWPDGSDLAAPSGASLTVCGGNLTMGTHAILSLKSATPNVTSLLFVSVTSNPTPFKGGIVVPVPPALLLSLPIGPLGTFSTPIPGGGGPLSMYLQFAYPAPGVAPSNVGLSNAVRVDIEQ